MELYADSYKRLRSEVTQSGLIPYTSIIFFAERMGIKGAECDRFELFIQTMHEYIEKQFSDEADKERKQKQSGHSRSIRR